MASTLGWGIVGTGGISALFAADISRATGENAVAVHSRRGQRAGEFAAEHGIGAPYGDYSGFLSDPAVGVVYIATPAGTHRRLAEQALLAGKHVVVEKPIALRAEEVRQLAAIASAQRRFLMEAMWMKFNPAIRALAATAFSGQIGEVRSVQASFGAPFPRDVGSRWSADLGGSALLDQGIYAVTLAGMLLGAPTAVHASGTHHAPHVDQTEWITLEYSGGRFAQLASSMVEWIAPRAAINGTLGYLALEPPFWAPTGLAMYGGAGSDAFFSPAQQSFEIEGNGFVPMIRSITEHIATGQLEHPEHTLEETARTFDTLDTIRDSVWVSAAVEKSVRDRASR